MRFDDNDWSRLQHVAIHGVYADGVARRFASDTDALVFAVGRSFDADVTVVWEDGVNAIGRRGEFTRRLGRVQTPGV